MDAETARLELSTRHWLPEQHGTANRAERRASNRDLVGSFRSATRTAIRDEIFTATPTETTVRNAVEVTVDAIYAEQNDRPFGVEMEFFGTTKARVVEEFTARGLQCVAEAYNHNTRNHWKVVTDASVNRMGTGEGSGLELVSPILRGEAGFASLALACEALAAAGAKVDRSCGVHVHHDTRDLRPADVYRTVRIYTEGQAFIDSVLPPSRRSNGGNFYCVAYAPHELSSIQRTAESAISARRMAGAAGGRYRTVNLESLSRHGTLEFRQHSGSVEGPKVAAWVRLGQAIIWTARRDDCPNPSEDLASFLSTVGVSEEDRSYFIQRASVLARPRAARRQVMAGAR